jgi:eukaryotic-like serine/threonine-protein kinase
VTITMKCLAKEPGRRYATAGELAEDLRRFQSGETIAAQELGLIERVAWMLEKSQHDTHFAHLAVCFFWFAPLFLLPELLAALAKYWYPSALTWPWWVYAGYSARVALGIGMFVSYSRRFWPTNPAEQHIVSVWGAFVFSAILLTLNMDELTGVSKYQALASMSGLAFVSLGSMFWGRFYLIGLAFLMLVPLMLMCKPKPWLVPILYGALWSATSLMIGFRLRTVQKLNESLRN